MLKQARKIARDSLFSGFLLTVIVVVASAGGALDNVERWFYDKRATSCQFFTPPPTNKLVHLDVDDGVLDSIGAWPWHRAILAEMLDELRLAGPKAVAMDLLFSEPQDPRFVPGEHGSFDRIADDELLADSIRKLGCVIVPMSLPIVAPQKPDPIEQMMRRDLRDDPQLTDAELVDRLTGMNIGSVPAIQRTVAREFLPTRREAIYLRIRQELLSGAGSMIQIRSRLFKKTDQDMTTPVMRVFAEEYEHATADVALRRFERNIPPRLPTLLSSQATIPPIPVLARAAAGTAFFDYPREKDGKVRRVPLFMEHDGLMVPQIGLSLAMAMLGDRADQLRVFEDHLEMPRNHGAPVIVPVYTLDSEAQKQQIPMMFDIPWFGSSDWETMYQSVGGAHVSLNALWEIRQTCRKIEKNNLQAREALRTLYAGFAPEKVDSLNQIFADLGNPDAGHAEMTAALAEYGEFIKAAQNPDPAVPFKDEQERRDSEFIASAGLALTHAANENPLLSTQLTQLRRNLRQNVYDKAVLIGWAATASIADMVPTSLHPRVPGVVLHGVIFNAMMTGRFLTRMGTMGNLAVTAFFGFLTTLLASRLSPTRAFIYALVIALMYIIINGILLYDYLGRIVVLGGPLVVIGIVWAGCTLVRLLAESIERAQITRRFRSYVDPTLVNFLQENPDSIRLTGEKRELTVCFTDLEGFTTIAEQFGEAAVPLLNEFMEMAVPIIREHGGYVNKFLGDGIMFFFGAPRPMPDHAARAFRTILSLKAAMVGFNERSRERNLPHLSLRAGVSSGEMVVGDAGSREASDYTVLGNAVNLGARLETANKFLGSRNLANRRAIELAGDGFLVRPVGHIRYVGKTQGVDTYEVLALSSEADAGQHRLAELTRAIVEAYAAGNAAGCLSAIEQMESEIGRDKFTSLFRELHETRLKPARDGPFDPLIVLTEK